MRIAGRLVVLVACLTACAAQTGNDNQCKDFDPSKLDGTNPKDYCTYQIAHGTPPKVGDICLAKPQDAHPTQAAYGEVDAGCVQMGLEAYAQSKDGSLREYLQGKPVPTIMGPDGVLFITDHHHLSVALLHAFLPYEIPMIHRLLFMCIGQDFSSETPDTFWEKLEQQNMVWLYDNRGNSITSAAIPHSVKYLQDDPYRTLALWSREAFAYIKCGGSKANEKFPQCQDGKVVAKAYIEFKWANVFRKQYPLIDIYDQSDQAQVANMESIFPAALVRFATDSVNKDMEGYNLLGFVSTQKVKLDDYGCLKDSVFVRGEGGGRDNTAHNSTHTILRTSDMEFALTVEQLEFVQVRQKEIRQERLRKVEAQRRLAHKQRLDSIVN